MIPRVCILLAIHNGERFLEQQLDSIAAQTHRNWQLLAYDDSSTDGSLDVLRAHPVFSRCTLLPTRKSRLGAKGAFSLLLESALTQDADCFALCDQDDVWQPEKLALLLETWKAYRGKPVLVHSDMEVCDDNLYSIAPSYLDYTNNRHEPPERALKTLLNKNFVSGCTSLFDRSLLELATPVPEDAYMHDWWLALCAAAVGQIHFIARPLVLYRQHEANSVGAQTDWQLLRLRFSKGVGQLSKQFFATTTQAGSMAEHLRSRQPGFANCQAHHWLQAYAGLAADNRGRRLLKLAQGCCLHRNLWFRMIFVLQLLISKPRPDTHSRSGLESRSNPTPGQRS